MKGKELLGLYNGLQAGKSSLENLEKIIYHDWLIVLVRNTEDLDEEKRNHKFTYICQNDKRFASDDNVFFSLDFSYLDYKFLDFCAAFKLRSMDVQWLFT